MKSNDKMYIVDSDASQHMVAEIILLQKRGRPSEKQTAIRKFRISPTRRAA